MDVSITTGSDVLQAFRLIGNWAVASKGWSTGVSGSLVAEAGAANYDGVGSSLRMTLLSWLLVLDG